MRGRLIRPVLLEIARLDRARSGAGSPAFDDDFRETALISAGQGAGSDGRRELPLVQVRAQLQPMAFARATPAVDGNLAQSEIEATLHLPELERGGLIEPSSGLPLLGAGDRLVAIRNLRGRLLLLIPHPPGLFVTETRPASFGLGLGANLLIVTFRSRDQGQVAVS